MSDAIGLINKVVRGDLYLSEAAIELGMTEAELREMIRTSKGSMVRTWSMKFNGDGQTVVPPKSPGLEVGEDGVIRFSMFSKIDTTVPLKTGEVIGKSIVEILRYKQLIADDPSNFLRAHQTLQGWIKLLIEQAGMKEEQVMEITQTIEQVIQFAIIFDDKYPGLADDFEEFITDGSEV